MTDSLDYVSALLIGLLGGGGIVAIYNQLRHERSKKSEWLREKKYSLYDELSRFIKRLGFVRPDNKEALERIYDLTVSIQLLTDNLKLVKKIENLTDAISLWLQKDLMKVDLEQHTDEMDELFEQANKLLKELQKDLLG